MVMSMPSPSSALVLAKMKSRKSGLKSLPPAAPARSRLWSVVEPTAVMVTVRVPRTAETSVAAAVPVPARDSKPGWMKGRMSSMSTARVEPAAGLGKTSGSRGLVGHEISVPSPKESPSESYLVGSVPGWAGPVEGRSGFSVASGKVHVHDLQATLLHLLGIDHTRLTYRFQGRYFRLTDVHGNVVTPLLA